MIVVIRSEIADLEMLAMQHAGLESGRILLV